MKTFVSDFYRDIVRSLGLSIVFWLGASYSWEMYPQYTIPNLNTGELQSIVVAIFLIVFIPTLLIQALMDHKLPARKSLWNASLIGAFLSAAFYWGIQWGGDNLNYWVGPMMGSQTMHLLSQWIGSILACYIVLNMYKAFVLAFTTEPKLKISPVEE